MQGEEMSQKKMKKGDQKRRERGRENKDEKTEKVGYKSEERSEEVWKLGVA